MSALKKKYNPKMIELAIQSALSVFAVFLALGVALIIGGIHLGFGFGMILLGALLFLIIARLIIMSTGLTQYNKISYIVGIILFAVYVLYDTNIILQRNYSGDFITASLDYYLDILNLFTNFLGANSD
jgi:FtsH-binding integral membrane protein